jgi:hypothetical protein
MPLIALHACVSLWLMSATKVHNYYWWIGAIVWLLDGARWRSTGISLLCRRSSKGKRDKTTYVRSAANSIELILPRRATRPRRPICHHTSYSSLQARAKTCMHACIACTVPAGCGLWPRPSIADRAGVRVGKQHVQLEYCPAVSDRDRL